MLDAGCEIVGNTVAGEFERQHLPGGMPVEPDEVKAVPGFRDDELAGPHALQCSLEFRDRLATRQLSQAPAILG